MRARPVTANILHGETQAWVPLVSLTIRPHAFPTQTCAPGPQIQDSLSLFFYKSEPAARLECFGPQTTSSPYRPRRWFLIQHRLLSVHAFPTRSQFKTQTAKRTEHSSVA